MSDRRPARLDFPRYEFRSRNESGTEFLLDPIRRRWVIATREEWVRLHVVQFLIRERSVPPGLVNVEVELEYDGLRRRADVVVYRSDGSPVLVVECKSPEVPLTQAVVDQASRYNRVLRAGYVMITNGVVHYIFRIAGGSAEFLPDLPDFKQFAGRASGTGPASRPADASDSRSSTTDRSR